MDDDKIKIKTDSLCFFYQNRRILENITARFAENSITAIVGPSGTGKSTLLMTLNRLWESIPGTRIEGKVEIRFDGRFHDIYARSYPVTQLRRAVGMVFQIPNPLPMSIYKNIAFPLKLAGYRDKNQVAGEVEEALKQAYLWDEVKDRLEEDAFALSGGQQQRLCIARALVLKPDILLLDEPTSSLDATSGKMIEELLLSLKNRCTILVVSHYLDQVRRIADTVAEVSDSGLSFQTFGSRRSCY
ncbi:ATP-binding cassette domain-containing protein [Desulfococcaceae bacterium HSG8]|nr:ATP-binding cassette domain-containing protein [Desulfococcaceae bacterium HSG8]